MASTLDYLRWRGDLPFQACPFNSLDASLMASLAYLPFDGSTVGHSLGEVCQSIYQREPDRWQNLDKTELLLLPKSPRLADLTVLDWVNKMEIEPEPIQFNAGAFRLDDRTILVAYRGTDQSMIGWSEDMVMDYTPEITGHRLAAKYLNQIGQAYPNDRIYITGHSKGGNYAHYALAFADPQIQARVIKSYSFDGPGYRHQIYGTSGFQDNIKKMKTYIPESSIVGCMLDHTERVLVVKCNQPVLSQHDPRTWSVGRDSYVLAQEGLTTTARVIRHSLIAFNHQIPAEKRGQMWSALFEAFDSLDITKIKQISGFTGTYRFGRAYFAWIRKCGLSSGRFLTTSLKRPGRALPCPSTGAMILTRTGRISMTQRKGQSSLMPTTSSKNNKKRESATIRAFLLSFPYPWASWPVSRLEKRL
ncbi:hypothetical protein LBUL_0013 [Lactobacillus delbrueckii subsp. bulgaricus ATCC BAA-365]|nr:hypothetical protein LBUL_0013 [Lactobacillus delbrueckii subsp. bulgaricus ATCC BAA-365]